MRNANVTERVLVKVAGLYKIYTSNYHAALAFTPFVKITHISDIENTSPCVQYWALFTDFFCFLLGY